MQSAILSYATAEYLLVIARQLDYGGEAPLVERGTAQIAS